MMPPQFRGGPAKPINEPPLESAPVATPPLESTILHGVGNFMISSLPSMASGADVYARQFYRGSRVPFRRYLPVTKQ